MEKSVQEKFDALVAEHGATAVIAAVKGHKAQPNEGGDCRVSGCPLHYICNPGTGHCQLDIG